MTITGVRRATAAGIVLAATVALPSPALAASSGTLAAPQYLEAGTWASSAVEIADVTADGRPDILLAVAAENNTQTGALLVYAQRADRTYAAPVRITAHGQYSEVRLAVADINGDARTDVAMSTGAGLDVFYQRATGGLAAPVLVGAGAADVEIADVTRDGRPDLVASRQDGLLQIYPQSASRTFGVVTDVTGGPIYGGGAAEKALVADFNHDGRLDLAQVFSTGAWVRLALAAGGWGPATVYQVGNRETIIGAQAGDVTGNGRADLVLSVLGNRPDAGIAVFAQGAGGLNPVPAVYPAYDAIAGLAIGDLNGDGRKDVVGAHANWLAVSVTLQQSSGALGGYRTTAVDGISFSEDAVAIGDVTGDGRPDVVAVAYTRVAILRQV